MLTAKTFLENAGAKGIGLFAAEPIAAGEEITSDYRQLCLTCSNGLPFGVIA